MQGTFALHVLAISSATSAAVAEEIVRSGARLEQFYGTMLVVAGINLAFFALPLLMFMRPLRAARSAGIAAYMELASTYVNAFDDKWRSGEPDSRDLLGSADIQSLADMGNAARVVEEMRFSPVSPELLSRLAALSLLPFLPLLLLELPVHEIARNVLERLMGG
jgi:hypothetical protein